jgi:hypothetical protein
MHGFKVENWTKKDIVFLFPENQEIIKECRSALVRVLPSRPNQCRAALQKLYSCKWRLKQPNGINRIGKKDVNECRDVEFNFI